MQQLRGGGTGAAVDPVRVWLGSVSRTTYSNDGGGLVARGEDPLDGLGDAGLRRVRAAADGH